MFDTDLKVKSGFPAEKVLKSLRFGAANALTQTAKQAQSAVQDSLRGAFTLRGKWFEQSNKYGIKIKPAKPDNLTAEVYSGADWLLKQEQGGQVLRYRHDIAIPTSNVRPKGSNKIIRGPLKPSAIMASGKGFIIKSKKTDARIMFMRKGRKKNIVAMYVLVPKIAIKPEHIFYKPIHDTVEKNLQTNINTFVQKALDDIR